MNGKLVSIKIILLFVLASCSTKQVQTVTIPTPQSLGPIAYGDAKLVEVAKEIPNFGGMYYDNNGTLNVFLVEDVKKLSNEFKKDRISRIKSAILKVYGDLFFSIGYGGKSQEEMYAPKKPFQINLKQGEYKLNQLAKWRTNINKLLELPSVVYTDLDESKNRVKIGILPTAPVAKIEAKANKLGIPPNALIVEISSPYKFNTSLKQKIRPVPGAVQIAADTGFFEYSLCTMGFNADRNCTYGFVTCSHCTKRQGGGGSNTDFHQPKINEWSWLPWVSSNKIGDEMIDPGYFSGGVCPANKRCRYSDSAFIEYDRKRDMGNDEIARTDNWNNGSLTIDNNNPRMYISAEWPNVFVGQEAHKIGRTT